MQFRYLSLSLFAAVAAAQTNSTTTLTGLVSQLPTCALSCFASSAKDAGCATTDFTCLCGSASKTFIGAIVPCIFLSSCSSADLNKATTLAPEICTEVAANPSTSDVAQASGLIASAVGTATGGAASPTSSNGAAAPTHGAGIGVMGMAALAAFAL